jgi:hypothetical protein
MTHRKEGKVWQKLAKPKVNANGDAIEYRESTAILEEQIPQKKLVDNALVVAVAFFSHSWIAHHQAMMLDTCIDGLGVDSIAIIIDYSMSYAHTHADASQSEWWSAHQSTVLPVIVYMKDKHGNVTWTRSILIIF